MAGENEKRNSAHGIASTQARQGELFEEVGGRQEPSPAPVRGGGYQNKCTVLNFAPAQKKRDPRLDELKQIGLQRVWQLVAEEIGVDAFLRTWRILDAEQSSIGDDGRLLIPIKSYRSYQRFQRNRYVDSLVDMGLSPAAIKEHLEKHLNEKLSNRHIWRLTSKSQNQQGEK